MLPTHGKEGDIMPKPQKLSRQQEKFVQELIIGEKTQREAYRAAYPSSKKWKDDSVDTQASRLLHNNPAVKARYNELYEKMLRDTEEKAIVTRQQIIEEYAKVAFSDIKDYVTFGTEKVFVDYDSEGRPVADWKQIVSMLPSDKVDGTLINEVSISPKGTLTFKLHDKMKALDALAKIFGMFVDKAEISGSIDQILQIVIGDEDDEDEDDIE